MPRYTLPILGALVLVACGGTSRPESERPASESSPAASRSEAAPDPATARRTGGTPIEITAVVDGRELKVSGLGECKHSAEGSIYERPASLWTATYDGGEDDPVGYLNLTFWRERSGTEAVTMALEVGSTVHRIATVRGGERQGSGTTRLDGDASAGTLVVEGTTSEGTALRLRARCSRFTALVAEGG
jgi:hypothetical protein